MECGEAGEDLLEERHANRIMNKASRKVLINLLYNYLIEKFDGKPSKTDIVSVCQNVVQIFPSLRVTPSSIGGIVSDHISFYNFFVL